MRGASLRFKINLAIFLAFVASALAFGSILNLYLSSRQATAQNRTRVLLAVLAAHRLEALRPLLDQQSGQTQIQDILDHLVRVEGVTEAALFDASGAPLAVAGSAPKAPLVDDAARPLPTSRVFAVTSDKDSLTASLVEPVVIGQRIIGYLRLRYSLEEIHRLNQHLWIVGTLAVIGAYALLTVILNLLLHRFVLRPVDTLRQGLEAVQSGNMGHTVPVFSTDALGRVAMAFNAMSAQLRDTCDSLGESRAEIEEHRQLLSTRVEERTAELAEANRRLVAEIEARRTAETSQKKALALYKAILESTAEAVVCVGMLDQPVVLAHNRRFIELWGLPENWSVLESADERILLIMDKLVDPGDMLVNLRSLLSDSQTMDVTSLQLKDGRVFERRSGPILQGDTCIGRVFSYVDATAERHRQHQLEQAKSTAEDASQAKGAFLAVMSHEIRTPLNAISGLAEELLAGKATDAQRRHLRTIQEASSHLLGVINDVLDFSKIEAGKLVLERTDFLVRDLIEATARVLTHEARGKNLGFTVTVHDDVPPVLRGDPGRLRQVLLNLLGNAIKFTEHGGVTLDVMPAPQPDHGDDRIGLAFRIADTGIGMDEQSLAGLFHSFHQGPGSITRRYGGTGLGLAISKQIVERMGGHIEVLSRKDEGSTFLFTVRLQPGRSPAVCPLPGERGGAGRGLRILMVEDNPLNASVTRLHMERLGHAMTEAASAREAYALLGQERFDVVLMDIEMPDIDGITAARTIRAGGPPGAPVLDPTVPIIAVTAHAIEEMRLQCLEAGMDGFVTKPVNYQVLRQALEASGHAAGDGDVDGQPDPDDLETAARQDEDAPRLFDPETARKALGITWDQFNILLDASLAEGEQRLEQVRAGLNTGDTKAAAIAAHTLKSAAATIGAYACQELAMRLEAAVRQEDAQAGRALLGQVEALWREVRAARQGWRPPDET